MHPREDAYCPACPDPETAFRIDDVGMKFTTDGDYLNGDNVTFKVTRPAWEPVMMEHLRSVDDDEHRRIYDLCVTELIAMGLSAEESARYQVQSLADAARSSMGDWNASPMPEGLDLRPQLLTGIPQRLTELSPWTDRINTFNRSVLEEDGEGQHR